MGNCDIKLNIAGEEIHFNDEIELKRFVSNNYHRLNSLDNNFGVSFSKEFSPSEETNSKIQKIIEENKLLTESTTDKYGDRMVTAPGYTGVNRFIDNAVSSISGKKLVSSYNEDTYRENTIDKVKAELLNEDSTLSTDDVLLTKLANDKIDKTLKEFSMLGSFGTEFHSISEFIFKDGLTELDQVRQALKKKYPDSNFHDNAIIKMYNYIIDNANKIKKDHGDEAKIYPEFVIHDNDTKIVGILDLLVIDKNGKAHIYDYKLSHKKANEWSNVKLNRMKYQMSFYNQLLLKKGILTNSINLLPLDMSDIDYELGLVNDIDTTQKPIDISSDIKNSYYQKEANSFIPVSLSQFINDDVSTVNIKKELMASFGYSLQTNLDIKGLKVKTDDNGREYFYNKLTGKKEFLEGDAEEKLTQLESYKAEYAASENHEISQIKGRVKKYLSDNEEILDTFYSDDKTRKSFTKLFRPFRGTDWELIDDNGLDSAGIIAFQNKITKTVEFISFTSNQLESIIKLNKGTTILGNFNEDRFLYNEKDLLKSTTYNIEALKVAMWMNANHELFKNMDCNIGDIRVATTNMDDIKGVNSKEIISSYQKLTTKSGVQFNLHGIKSCNPFDILLTKITDLMMEDDKSESKAKHAYTYQKIGEALKDETIGSGYYVNLSPVQIAEKLKTLSGIVSSLKSKIMTDELDLNNDMHFLYYLAQASVSYYNNLENLYTEDIKQWSFNESKQSTSAQNFQNKTIKMFNDVFSKAKANIGHHYNSFNSDANTLLLKFFEDSGFNRGQQLAYGKMKDIYANLWEKNGDKIDSEYRCKDPYTDKSLLDYEKKFLIKYLELLNNHRYKSKEEIDEAKGNGDYFKMPLIKVKDVVRLKQKGVLNTVKDSYMNNIDFNNLFDDEAEQNKAHSKAMDSMYNPFNAQKSNNVREDMINELGVDEFDHDFQSMLKTCALASIKEKEFNKILPVIDSIRTTTFFKNNNLSNTVTKNIDEFIQDYVKSVIFGEKLIEPHQEKWVKFASGAKQLTTTALLAFNFPAGVRDFLQGSLTNTINAASKTFGYNINSSDLHKAYAFLTKESVGMAKSIDLIDSMNQTYMVSTMDIKQLADRSMVGQNGFFTFRGEQLYAFNALADYYNRMSLFVARMIQDGSLDAHKLKDNKLVYDWKLDKRFNIYSKGKGMESNPEYNKQRGEYLTMIREFNAQKLTDIPLKEGDDLPQAYTYEQINSVKNFSNLIHGYYDQDSKILFQQTWLGVAFMQFRSWLKAKADQHMLARGSYNIKERKQGTENGELLWFKVDEDGNESITTENTGIPYYPLEDSVMEGMLVSLGRFFKTCYQSKMNVSEIKEIVGGDKLMVGNMKALSTNLVIWSVLAALVGSIDWPEFKKESPLLGRISWTISKAGDDLFIGNNINMIVNPKSFIPSASFVIQAGDNVFKVINGSEAGQRAMMNSFGITRPFSYITEE